MPQEMWCAHGWPVYAQFANFDDAGPSNIATEMPFDLSMVSPAASLKMLGLGPASPPRPSSSTASSASSRSA
eukprot:7302006-Alexandrium_andersonii.AAC.1